MDGAAKFFIVEQGHSETTAGMIMVQGENSFEMSLVCMTNEVG